MADVAPSPANPADGVVKSRPEKPDETKYKADLAKAEKEHELKMKEYVCRRVVCLLSLAVQADFVRTECQEGRDRQCSPEQGLTGQRQIQGFGGRPKGHS
jgi:hypothetical protein